MKWTPDKSGRAFRTARPHVTLSEAVNLNLVLEISGQYFNTVIIIANSISFVITLIKLRIAAKRFTFIFSALFFAL
jgi:hypothetical protein